MDFEQACRTRSSTGYAICAKTEGITARDESSMGELFNDIMNTLVPKMGERVYTCASKGERVFLTLSTMRTDSFGRPSIFHHSYIIPREYYAQCMRVDPAVLLSVPLEGMRDHEEYTPLSSFGTDSFQEQAYDLKQLRSKYQLDTQRYAELLLLGYRAMTSGTSLCLQAAQGQDPLTLVRDFVYCLAVGLVPLLRGNITYSTAADLRQRVCVQLPGRARIGAGAALFPVDPSTRPAHLVTDPLTSRFFDDLAKISTDAAIRDCVLQHVNDWLVNVTSERHVTLQLISTAYYLSYDLPRKAEELSLLMRSLESLMHSAVDATPGLDAALIQLMTECGQAQVYPVEMLDELAGYVDYATTPEYVPVLQQYLSQVPEDDRLDLMCRLFRQSNTDVLDQIIVYLLQITPCTEAQDNDILRWFMQRQIQDVETCRLVTDILGRTPSHELVQLVSSILDGTANIKMSQTEGNILQTSLEVLCARQGEPEVCVDNDHGAMLDDLWNKEETFRNVLMRYLLTIRLAYCRTLTDKMALLHAIHCRQPQYFEILMHSLLQSPTYEPGLLENYYKQEYIMPLHSKRDLTSACQNYNLFQDPNGPFERSLHEKWVEESKLQLQKVIANLTANVQREMEILSTDRDIEKVIEWIEAEKTRIQALNVSDDTRNRLWMADKELFWQNVTCVDVVWNYDRIPDELYEDIPESAVHQRELMYAVRDFLAPNYQTNSICRLLFRQNVFQEGEMQKIQDGIGNRMFLLIREESVFLIDLLLLATAPYDTKDKRLSLKLDLPQAVSIMMQYEAAHPHLDVDSLRAKREDSYLLKVPNNMLWNKLCKRVNKNKTSQILQMLTDSDAKNVYHADGVNESENDDRNAWPSSYKSPDMFGQQEPLSANSSGRTIDTSRSFRGNTTSGDGEKGRASTSLGPMQPNQNASMGQTDDPTRCADTVYDTGYQGASYPGANSDDDPVDYNAAARPTESIAARNDAWNEMFGRDVPLEEIPPKKVHTKKTDVSDGKANRQLKIVHRKESSSGQNKGASDPIKGFLDIFGHFKK